MKKNISLVLIAIFAVMLSFPALSQELPKAEAKVWKDKLKAFYGQYKKDLAGFKKFIEDKDAAEAQIPKLEAEVNRLNDKQRQQADEIDDLRAENSLIEQQIKDLESIAANGGSGSPSPGGVPSAGVAFTVQLGSNSESVDTKYIIGIFDNYPQAQTMRDSLRKMGVKDAFVVAYKDGSRVPVTDVISDSTGQP